MFCTTTHENITHKIDHASVLGQRCATIQTSYGKGIWECKFPSRARTERRQEDMHPEIGARIILDTAQARTTFANGYLVCFADVRQTAKHRPLRTDRRWCLRFVSGSSRSFTLFLRRQTLEHGIFVLHPFAVVLNPQLLQHCNASGLKLNDYSACS